MNETITELTPAMQWLASLMKATSPKGVDIGRARIYAEALSDEAPLMTKQALAQAIRRFRTFPSVNELVSFFAEWRSERRPGPKAPDGGGMPSATREALARLAARDWRPPPGLNAMARRAWDEWALGVAREAVDSGRIRGRFAKIGGQNGFVMDATIPCPLADEGLMAEWMAIPARTWEVRD